MDILAYLDQQRVQKQLGTEYDPNTATDVQFYREHGEIQCSMCHSPYDETYHRVFCYISQLYQLFCVPCLKKIMTDHSELHEDIPYIVRFARINGTSQIMFSPCLLWRIILSESDWDRLFTYEELDHNFGDSISNPSRPRSGINSNKNYFWRGFWLEDPRSNSV